MAENLASILSNVIFDVYNGGIEMSCSTLKHRLAAKIKTEFPESEEVMLEDNLMEEITRLANSLPDESKRVRPLLTAKIKSDDQWQAVIGRLPSV